MQELEAVSSLSSTKAEETLSKTQKSYVSIATKHHSQKAVTCATFEHFQTPQNRRVAPHLLSHYSPHHDSLCRLLLLSAVCL